MSIYQHPTRQNQAARFAQEWSQAWRKRDVNALLTHCMEATEFTTPDSELGRKQHGKALLQTWLTSQWARTTRLASTLARQRGINLDIRLQESEWDAETLRLSFTETRPAAQPHAYETGRHYQALRTDQSGLICWARFSCDPMVITTPTASPQMPAAGNKVLRFFGDMFFRGAQGLMDYDD